MSTEKKTTPFEIQQDAVFSAEKVCLQTVSTISKVIDAARSDQTDIKHSAATAERAVAPLDDAPQAVLFSFISSAAPARQKGVAMVSVLPYKRKKKFKTSGVHAAGTF